MDISLIDSVIFRCGGGDGLDVLYILFKERVVYLPPPTLCFLSSHCR